MSFEKCLLRSSWIGAMEGCAAIRAAHGEDLQLHPLTAKIGVGFIPDRMSRSMVDSESFECEPWNTSIVAVSTTSFVMSMDMYSKMTACGPCNSATPCRWTE